VAGRDITDGRSTRAIAVDLGIGTGIIWQNSGIAYDVAIAGIPFFLGIKDDRPYERATAPFRKEQFDSQTNPGEQSLTGWWLRSQNSFHTGEGITFYDPLSNPYATTISTNSYRIKDAYGANIWTPGEVTLLREVNPGHITTHEVFATGRAGQHMRSITWSGKQGVLVHDGYDINRIDENGVDEHWVDNAVGQDPVFTLTDDGETAYWVTNDASSGKLEINKKLLSASPATSSTVMISSPSITVTNAVIAYVKQRLVVAINNKVYEFATSATALPTEVYTHPNPNFIFTSITESGTAIYLSGYNGLRSSIFKFTLNTTDGAMPSLDYAVTAAVMPAGEMIHKIYQYLGRMMIGTTKGVRVANISADGSLTYGPLITETPHPVYDFAARDTYVWCATGLPTLNIEPGLIRIDLSQEIDDLRFAYAKDLHYSTSEHSETTAVAFIGNTDRLMFCTSAVDKGTITNKALTSNVATLTTAVAHGLAVGNKVWIDGVDATFNSGSPYTGETVLSVPTSTTFTYTRTATNVASTSVSSPKAKVKIIGSTYVEHATDLVSDGYVETGYIRFNTLERKHFKRIVGLGEFNVGSMSLQTVDFNGTVYDVNSYDSAIGSPESSITQPAGSQDAIALRFRLYRDAVDPTVAPVFKGYQLKGLPANPRNRIIKIPLMNFDIETDKYNTSVGYEGRAFDRLAALETAESNGDIVSWQDFRTGEVQQVLIEQVMFTSATPPDKKLTGFGGIISLTIRTV
jgi:hypothetical protein